MIYLTKGQQKYLDLIKQFKKDYPQVSPTGVALAKFCGISRASMSQFLIDLEKAGKIRRGHEDTLIVL